MTYINLSCNHTYKIHLRLECDLFSLKDFSFDMLLYIFLWDPILQKSLSS